MAASFSRNAARINLDLSVSKMVVASLIALTQLFGIGKETRVLLLVSSAARFNVRCLRGLRVLVGVGGVLIRRVK